MTSTYLLDPSNTASSRSAKVGVGKEAALVLDHLLGDGMSVIEPTAKIWTVETAEALDSAIGSNLLEGEGGVWDKLYQQLSSQPRKVVLMAAEIVFLRDLPNDSIKPTTKVAHIKKMVSWLPDAPDLPDSMVTTLTNSVGAFGGGALYNIELWKQIPWYARFVARWAALPSQRQAEARQDPWTFHQIISDVPDDLPAGRNVLLNLAFPLVFEAIVSDQGKTTIRDAVADSIGGATGGDMEAVDRDLLNIRVKLGVEASAELEWYALPWWDVWNTPKSSKANRRTWLVQPGPDGVQLINRWLGDGFVSLTAAHFGTVNPGATKDQVKKRVEAGYPQDNYAQRHVLTEDYFAFLTTMSEGDVVLARHDQQAWVGRIAGDPEFAVETPRLRRKVEWVNVAIPFEELPDPATTWLYTSRLVVDRPGVRDQLEALLVGQDPPPDPRPEVVLPRATPELAAALNCPEEWLNEYIDLLESRRQIIVYGPPGTGKTFIARHIAQHVAGENLTVVQFHPSYAYEDFFEGLRPVTAEGSISYELVPGPLRRLADAAAAPENRGQPYVLIIDEINRADIAKVFGELYYLLEYRDESITLQYSPEELFSLPKNLYLIGAMNTADRSIALVDAAIRRRFPFIEMHPAQEPVKSVLATYLKANGFSIDRSELLNELNRRLGEGKQYDFQIGPSYLMRPEAETEAGLARIWRYDILPLLEEQLYGTHTREQVHQEFGLETIRHAVNAQQALPTPNDQGSVEP